MTKAEMILFEKALKCAFSKKYSKIDEEAFSTCLTDIVNTFDYLMIKAADVEMIDFGIVIMILKRYFVGGPKKWDKIAKEILKFEMKNGMLGKLGVAVMVEEVIKKESAENESEKSETID